MRCCAHLLALAHVVGCFAFSIPAIHHDVPLPVRTLHQFAPLTYLQDLAIGSSGDIYMTTVNPGATIYHVAGATSSTPVTSTIHKFDGGINATTGIIETRPGLYNFLAGGQSSLGVGILDTWGIFELDTRHSGEPKVTELVHIDNGGLIVSVIPVPGVPDTLLVSDSTLGKIWRVNTVTGKYEVILQDDSMNPPAWAPLPFGIGGIQYHKGYLYFVVCFEALIYRIRFTDEGYPAPGAKIELVYAYRSIYIDNFVVGPGDEDIIWAATNADNRLVAITPEDGKATVVAGAPDEFTVAGDVALAFGALPGDTETLYVVTGGGMLNPLNGTVFEGGKIVSVNTTSFVEEMKEARTGGSSLGSKSAYGSQHAVHGDVSGSGTRSVLQLLHVCLNYIVGR